MRVHRLISILLLIESNDKMKAKELASKLETSIRTIYRDIDILCEAGFPITTTTGPNGGIHFTDGYSVGIEKLHSDDIMNLYLGGMGIQVDKQSEIGLKINNALLKLEKNLPNESIHDIDKIKKRFYFDISPWWGESQKSLHIDSLIHSIWASKKINITYKKANGDISKRKVQPYGIVVKRMDWYLVAYCEENCAIRTFKCERITSVEATSEEVEVPNHFSLEQYWKHSEKHFKITCAENEQYEVVIKLHKRWRTILEKLEIMQLKQEDTDFIIVTINMYKYEYACQDVIEFIGCVEVLEPLELRDFVKQEISNLMTIYEV